MMDVDTLTGIYANSFEIVAAGTNDPATGRPLFRVFLKQGATAPQVGDSTLTLEQLGISRRDAKGGQANLAGGTMITAAPLSCLPTEFCIEENTLPGSDLGPLNVSGGTPPYTFAVAGDDVTISAAGVAAIAINPITQTYYNPNLWDFESTPNSSFAYTVTDAANASVNCTFTIKLIDVPEAPELSPAKVDTTIENGEAAGFNLGDAVTLFGNSDWVLAGIVSGDPGGDFSITSSPPGTITTTTVMDVNANSFYTLGIQLVNSAGLSSIGLLCVTVNNISFAQSIIVDSDAALEISGAPQQIPQGMLQATAPGITAENIVYELNSSTYGTFFLNGVELTVTDTWTQADINNGLLTYQFETGLTSAQYYSSTASISPTATVTISAPPATSTTKVLVIDSRPVILTNSIATSTHTISNSELNAVGIGQANIDLTYSITYSVGNGRFQMAGSNVSSFTQEDINDSLVTWVNDGYSEITMTVTDADGDVSDTASATFL